MNIKKLKEELNTFILDEDMNLDVEAVTRKIESIRKHANKLAERINYKLLDNVSYTDEVLNKIIDNLLDDLYEADEYLMQAYRILG